jgi:hypothetical protein
MEGNGKQIIFTSDDESIVREFSIEELRYLLIPNHKIRERIIEKRMNGEEFPFEKEDNKLDGEVFKKYPQNPKHACTSFHFREFLENNLDDLDIWVSNYGRIKKNNKELLKPYLDKSDNPKDPNNLPEDDLWCVNIKDKQKYYIYRLVAETWLEYPNGNVDAELLVHHITNDGYDNTPSNLLWVTKSFHGKIGYKR